jgi:hypothetical protein
VHTMLSKVYRDTITQNHERNVITVFGDFE